MGHYDSCRESPTFEVEHSGKLEDDRHTRQFPKPEIIGKNPKTSAGRAKPALLSVIPTAALLHLGEVMKLGASKYGPFNWREEAVPAEVYIDAAGRHLLSWWDGEDLDPESGMSHLAHVIACMSILIDAKEHGMLEDNRPKKGRIGEMIANFQRTGDFNPE